MLATLLLLLGASAVAHSTYVGCFHGSVTNNVLTYRGFVDKEMVPDKCLDYCYLRRFVYYGLLEGDKCYCGNQLIAASRLPDSSCEWRCGGNHDLNCGGDLGILISTVTESLYVPNISGYRKLLFSIRANCGRRVLDEYNRVTYSEQPVLYNQQDVYRSGLLNNLPSAIRRFGARRIVTEMRKNDRMVAVVDFDVSYDIDSLDSHNWFSISRLVRSYPVALEKSSQLESFSTSGTWFAQDWRRFYIHQLHGGCANDWGVLGIGDAVHDACPWVTNGGRPPVLFYAPRKGAYSDVVQYADHFVIYLQ